MIVMTPKINVINFDNCRIIRLYIYIYIYYTYLLIIIELEIIFSQVATIDYPCFYLFRGLLI